MVGDHEYPDWWTITVWRVVPHAASTVEHQRADHELELKTDSIAEFLIWYQKTWAAYDEQQNKVLEGNSKFDKILLCDCHHLPLRMCVQREMNLQAVEFFEDGYLRDDVFYPYSARFPRPEHIPTEEPMEVQSDINEMASVGVDIFTNERDLEASWSLGIVAYLTTYFVQLSMYCFLEFTIFRNFVGWL